MAGAQKAAEIQDYRIVRHAAGNRWTFERVLPHSTLSEAAAALRELRATRPASDRYRLEVWSRSPERAWVPAYEEHTRC
jgi:hypothetical protein